MEGLAAALVAESGTAGEAATRLRAMILLALNFRTSSRLSFAGFDDEAAASLMAGAVRAIASQAEATG